MRIQNNITAMNTHRMYTINNDNVAKSAAKLSSGYRINSAADDAAGLAISEKMRSQIRGLNMATKNSQDAISLVQTAEGALQETHSMLQRMNELAVQAATGTNEDFDRNALAKEFEQLKREINDVAEQTTFNNMKILDGSLSYKGYVRSAATAGVNNTITTDGVNKVTDNAGAAETGAAVTMLDSISGVNGVTGTVGANGANAVSETWTPAAGAQTSAIAGAEAMGGSKANLLIDLGDGRTLTTEIRDVGTAGNDITLGDLLATGANSFNGALKWSGGVDDTSVATNLTLTTATTSNGSFSIGLDNGKEVGGTEKDIDWTKAKVSLVLHDTSGTPGTDGKTIDITSQLGTLAGAPAAVGTTFKATVADVASSATYKIDASKVKVGDTFEIDGKTYEVSTAGEDLKDGATSTNIRVDWDGKDGAALVQELADQINATTQATVGAGGDTSLDGTGASTAATASGNLLTIHGAALTAPAAGADPDHLAADTDAAVQGLKSSADAAAEVDPDAPNPNAGKTNTIEFDIAKMKDGDTFKIHVDGKDDPITVTYNGESRADFMKKVETAAGDVGQVKGNALIIKDQNVSKIDLEWDEEALNKDTNAIRIQVGANENEQLMISIDSMNTEGLGLDNATLYTAGASLTANQDSDGAAITAVKKAINKVSDLRATLGAMQNRLDHKIANLKVSAENLTAAESRIRDVDMASEMTNFTKNNILSQAATAMLAQANALPQNVLSLLG